MGLEELRSEIQEKDREIVRLIKERTMIAEEIARIKLSEGTPLRNREVEKKVIVRYMDMGSQTGLDPEIMKEVASSLIKQAVDSEAAMMGTKDHKKVSIIGGAGKMGAWTASLLKRSGYDVSIIDTAVNNGLTVEDCKNSDIVIVSVPIHSVKGILEMLAKICGRETLIFDLSSLKTPFIDTLKDMAKDMRVCSIHPMFGPSARSMYDRNLIVCDCGNKDAVDDVLTLFNDRGENIRVMRVEEHDDYMSYVLGLTHAVNIALFTVLERSGRSFDDLRTVASTTFNKGLDTNRSVAMEDPMLYYEIQHMNASRDRMWSLFSQAVDDLRQASVSDDPSAFKRMMDAGREYFN